MTMTFTSFAMHRSSRWNHIKHQFIQWRCRVRSRGELQNLSDRTLRDIGVSRCEVHREAAKPFWMG